MTPRASAFIRRSVASVFFAWAMSATSASATPILSIESATTAVEVGDSVVFEIKIDDVVDLFTFSFDLLFDQTILSFQDITEGDFLTSGGDSTFFIPGTVFPPGSGIVSGTGNVVLGAPVSGDGILAIATFEALKAGASSITFQDLLFVNIDDAPIAFDDDDVGSGSVEVTEAASVPDESSTMLLLAASLVAFTAYRRFTGAW
jgi:hypothetical protein